MKIEVRTLRPGAVLPEKATAGSSGYDLRALLGEDLSIDPGQRVVVPTGIAIAMAEGTEAQVRPRSGLAARHGVTVLNAPGTIDSDYRGEIGVTLINLGDDPFLVRSGDRIAQIVFARIEEVSMEVVEALDETDRGDGGFGSTGND